MMGLAITKQRGGGWAKRRPQKLTQETLVMDWGEWVGESGREKEDQVTAELLSGKIPRTKAPLTPSIQLAVHCVPKFLAGTWRAGQYSFLTAYTFGKNPDSFPAELSPRKGPLSRSPFLSI